jgi:hypothetical protein
VLSRDYHHFDPHTANRVRLHHSTWCRTSRTVNLIGPNRARYFLTVAKSARLNQFERTEPGRLNNKLTAMQSAARAAGLATVVVISDLMWGLVHAVLSM